MKKTLLTVILSGVCVLSAMPTIAATCPLTLNANTFASSKSLGERHDVNTNNVEKQIIARINTVQILGPKTTGQELILASSLNDRIKHFFKLAKKGGGF